MLLLTIRVVSGTVFVGDNWLHYSSIDNNGVDLAYAQVSRAGFETTDNYIELRMSSFHQGVGDLIKLKNYSIKYQNKIISDSTVAKFYCIIAKIKSLF